MAVGKSRGPWVCPLLSKRAVRKGSGAGLWGAVALQGLGTEGEGTTTSGPSSLVKGARDITGRSGAQLQEDDRPLEPQCWAVYKTWEGERSRLQAEKPLSTSAEEKQGQLAGREWAPAGEAGPMDQALQMPMGFQHKLTQTSLLKYFHFGKRGRRRVYCYTAEKNK